MQRRRRSRQRLIRRLTVGVIAALLGALAVLAAEAETTPRRRAVEILRSDFDLYRMTLAFKDEEVRRQAQIQPARVSFEQALRRGMKSLLIDGSYPGSPWDQVRREICGNRRRADCEARSEIDNIALRRLHGYFNSRRAVLDLVPLGEHAEHGESPTAAWIFVVTLPELSSLRHWVVIDRKGVAPTYNYAF